MNNKIELTENNINKINDISRILNTKDISQAVRMSINLTEQILSEMDRGSTLFYETKSGRLFEVLRPGES